MDKNSCFFIGAMVGVIVMGVTVGIIDEGPGHMLSGKQFISGNATYKCTKTNELKAE